jgi:hypothetical protein
MPVWPKSFHTFGLSLKTASTEWKLRQAGSAPAAQERALAQITPQLAAASHWRGVGVEAKLPYATFRSRVPLQTYAQLAPAIAQMKAGAPDVLWPGRCQLFATTPGTATGQPKFLPITEELLLHFRRAGLDALLYYTVRVRHAGVFRGRHLLHGSPAVLAPLPGTTPPEILAGEISGIAALSLPAWAERHLFEPGVAVARVTDLEERIEAIAARSRSQDVSLLAGLPSWMAQLARSLREKWTVGKHRVTSLQARWPNLECFIHSGEPIGPYADELRQLLGPTVKFHEVYAATEGFIATQDGEGVQGLRVMADMGLFFEFLPLSEYGETRLEQLGPKAVPLADVKPGVDYVLVLTTPGGLARYLPGDVVRFTSTLPPRLIYVGRTDQRLNTFHELVSEREVSDALVKSCGRRDWTIVNFHVAPLIAPGNLTGQSRGRHEWWVELQPGTVATPTGPQLAVDLDAELQQTNETYAAKRKSGILDAPVVRLVMPGVFEHWLRFHQRLGGQYKVPRCGADRTIADEFAQITSFAQD